MTCFQPPLVVWLHFTSTMQTLHHLCCPSVQWSLVWMTEVDKCCSAVMDVCHTLHPALKHIPKEALPLISSMIACIIRKRAIESGSCRIKVFSYCYRTQLQFTGEGGDNIMFGMLRCGCQFLVSLIATIAYYTCFIYCTWVYTIV